MPNRRERRSQPISLTPVIALTILAAGLAFAQQNVPAPAARRIPPRNRPPEAKARVRGCRRLGQRQPGRPRRLHAKPAAAKGSPQRFEPTEKVRPDFDVAFPVDI